MRRLVVVVLALLASPALAFAAPIRWTLQDVRFSDGGTATGHIVVDVDLLRTQSQDGSSRLRLDDISVTTKGGDPGFATRSYRDGDGLFAEYSAPSADSVGSYGVITLRAGSGPSGEPHVLVIYLAAPISGGKGAVPILISNRRGFSGEYRANVSGERTIVGGQLVTSAATIPEPSLMMLLAVGGFAAFRRQRPRQG